MLYIIALTESMLKFLMLIFLVLGFGCSNHQLCKPGMPNRIFSMEGSNNGDISYSHYILIEGVSKNCDSTTVMSAIKNYIDTTNSGKPISSVAAFNSIGHYDSGETLSQPKEFFGDCVMEVWFEKTNGRPTDFIFFNNSGDEEYRGSRWRH
jgi:hypothetical protein